MFEIKGKYGTALITIDQLEDTALKQLYNMVNHPAFTEHIAIQADAHAGAGCVVGFTMPLSDKVVPNVCGVDLSCGFLCINIGKDIPMKLDKLDILIKRNIPMGTKVHDAPIIDFRNVYKWSDANEMANKFIVKYNEKFGSKYSSVNFDYDYFLNLIQKVGNNNALESLGTLGGGNHFISFEVSETNEDVWILIHSGSRNLGKKVCEYHQNIAKKSLENKRDVELRSKIEFITNNTEDRTIIPKLIMDAKKDLGLFLTDVNINGLEYLEGQDAMNYFMDMIFIYFYSDLNRCSMMNIILDILKITNIKDVIHSVHNYIDFKDMIIRKGAVSAYENEKIIVPMNMRDGSLICVGKSNEMFNFSAPHGAGRVMSRGEANRKIDLDKFKETMKGIYSSSVCKDTLDEAPFAYKKTKMIENAISDTATIIDRIKPVLNIKSSENENFKEIRKKEKEKKRQIGEDEDDLIANKDFRKDRKKLRTVRGKF
jgi:tRNA-splicing ligase RtcB